jgi:hypothetical protein
MNDTSRYLIAAVIVISILYAAAFFGGATQNSTISGAAGNPANVSPVAGSDENADKNTSANMGSANSNVSSGPSGVPAMPLKFEVKLNETRAVSYHGNNITLSFRISGSKYFINLVINDKNEAFENNISNTTVITYPHSSQSMNILIGITPKISEEISDSFLSVDIFGGPRRPPECETNSSLEICKKMY